MGCTSSDTTRSTIVPCGGKVVKQVHRFEVKVRDPKSNEVLSFPHETESPELPLVDIMN